MAVLRLAVVAVALALVQGSSASCGCYGPVADLAAPAYYGDAYAAAPAYLGGALAGAYGANYLDGYAPGFAPGLAPGYAPGFAPGYGLEEGCCPGAVIEKKTVVTKPVTVPYSYSVPTFSKKCFTTAAVDKKVIPSATVAQQCNEQITKIKVPTTDIITKQQPLCKKTCTTSEYIIQIPIVETTCTSAPLCKKTVRAQNNVLTTVAAKTACAQQTCTSNKVIQTPITQTVCQDYQGAINKVGAKTILKPEVKKTCVQLPPYKCLKPASGLDLPYGAYPGAYPAGLAYDGVYGDAYYGASTLPAYDAAYPALPALGAYPAVYPGYPDAYPGYPDAYPGYPGAYPGYPGAYPGTSCSCACA